MVALWNRTDHYIFALWLLLSFFLFFIPRLISAAADWMSAILPHMVWPYISANLECMSEMCCTWLAGNAGPQNRQNAPSGHHGANLLDDIFATKAFVDNRKKNFNSNTSSTCSDNTVNFGPLAAEICWRVWGTPVNFNGFRVLAALLHGTLVVSVSKLCGVE